VRGASGHSIDGRGRRIAVWVLRASVGLLALSALWRISGLGEGFPLVALIAFTPGVAAIAVLVLGVALYFRRWPEAAAAAVVALALAVAVLPRAFPGQATGPIEDGVAYDVLTVNVRLGEADMGAVAEVVRTEEVDLLSVQELTRGAARRLRAAGIDEILRHQELSPTQAGSSGGGLYSRYPLERLPDVPGGASRQVHGIVAVPGAGEVELVAAHPFPPTRSSTGRWQEGLEGMPRAEDDPLRILAGDFNATFDHAPFRDLVDSGYVDAAAARGVGLDPTWPANRIWPPEVTIDHVLADDSVHVADADVIGIPDTDHRAVFARLLLPPSRG
jgi:endonuclease/exonuclease/phosphatase family metal-dependent hydrolase